MLANIHSSNGSLRVWEIIISALLSVLIAGGTVIWTQQQTQIAELRQEVSQLQRDIGMLHGYDALSDQDRQALHRQLDEVTIRQGRVIGVLSVLAPNAAASILRSER